MDGLQHKHYKMLNMSEERPRPTSQPEKITANHQGNSFFVMVCIEVGVKENKKELVKLKRGEGSFRSNI